MTVYVLAPDDTAYSMNRHTARIGFIARGEDVCAFEKDEFDNLDLTEDDIVFGGVAFAKRTFRRLGWTDPQLPSIPDEMQRIAGRSTWKSTIGEVRRRVSAGERTFFKPLPQQLKRFTGLVATRVGDLVSTASIPDETEVECADVIDICAEYRTFVLNGSIIDLRPYNGDPLLFPDPDIVRDAVAAWASAPAAWAMDVAVTRQGETLLVEVNDGYAIGAYGLAPIRYAAMIDARWQQLRQQNAGCGDTV